MKWLLIFLFSLILVLPFFSALCKDGQIDINSASAGELKGIKHIGDARANKIIELRTEKLFESVNDLTRVSGIVNGGSRLEDIKAEGLACVKEIGEVNLESEEEVTEEVVEEEIKEEIVVKKDEESKEPVDLKVIELNPKVIKTDDSEESYNLYAILGLVSFSILLTFLFLLKKLKKNKNEFD